MMRVAFLDPSAFTVPYDVHLCESLVCAGAELMFYTRPVRSTDYFTRPTLAGPLGTGYKTIEHFYRVSERVPAIGVMPQLKNVVKMVEHVYNMATLIRRMKRFRPNIIHFQWCVLPSLDTCFVRRLRVIAPTVLTVHDINGFLSPTSRFQKLGWKGLLSTFDRLIVHTETGKAALIGYGIGKERIAVIPHGVFSYPRSRPPVERSHEQTVCLVFGSIKPYKGIDVLIHALAQLPLDVRSRIRVIIAGSPGHLGAELQSLAEQCGVSDRIEWQLQFIPDEDIPSLFDRCDAVVFPYRAIDASGVLMTSLPFGKAIIASRLGTFAELLRDGETALLVEPDNSAQLATALIEIVKNPDRAARLGANLARTTSHVYGWDRIAEMTLALYHQAGRHHEL